MVEKVFHSNKPSDQIDLVKYIASQAKLNPIVLFKGKMAAGKTTLIKNICNFLEVKDDISSPTFSLVNEYETEIGRTIYHFDFYRIEDEIEALDMGCEEYFESGHLCLIEWPSKIENLLPESVVEVEIELKDKQRVIAVRTF